MAQPTQSLRCKRWTIQLPPPSPPAPCPVPHPRKMQGRNRGGRAGGAGPPPGTLALITQPDLPSREESRLSLRFPAPRRSKTREPASHNSPLDIERRAQKGRPPQKGRPKPGRACTRGLSSRHPQAERCLLATRSSLAGVGLSSYLHGRLSPFTGDVRGGQAAVRCSENARHGSTRRPYGSCSRPARFKFPGGSAFRLAGLSLRCASIGGFEKHVVGGAS